MTESPSEPAPLRPLRGVALLMVALLAFAGMDATIKYLALQYPAPLVVAMRYLVHLSIVVMVATPVVGARLFQTQRTGLVLARGACLSLVSLLVSLALQRMPMAEMTAITFLAPMVVVLLAQPLLGERVGALEWLAAAAGLVGVLLIARPGAGLPLMGVALAFAAVGANAAYQMLSRSLARTEQAAAMLFYSALVGTIAFGLLLPWTLHGERPDVGEALLFLASGALAALGHYLLTLAYREAPASLLGPLNYVQLLWAGLLGWLVFAHVPDPLTILGLVIVTGAGALVAFQAHAYTRR